MAAGAGGEYWVCVVTRDGAGTLRETLDSILGQTHAPTFVVVVDDGSTDGTPEILRKVAEASTGLHVVRTPSATRDIRRVPILLNLGMTGARGVNPGRGLPRYMLVSGDDSLLSANYAASLVERMDSDPRVAVSSGSWLGRAGRTKQVPTGTGRLVRTEFMESIGGRYPVAYGWEAWLIYKAMQRGLVVKNYPDVRYRHLRPYSPHNLIGWGRGMYSLGFPTAFVLLRFGINFLWTARGIQSRRASVSMLAGYLAAKLDPAPLRPNLIDDQELRSFVRRASVARLTRVLW